MGDNARNRANEGDRENENGAENGMGGKEQ